MEKQKIIVILGQTSTGKSDFAVDIAKKFNGEIISADSRQVYQGMNLGTGKITKKEMRGVPHYLLDVTSPGKVFSVNQFQKLANKKIKEITKKGKIAIICGGTGFYIDSIINNQIFPKVPPNKKLRKTLEGKTAKQLFEILNKLDKERSKNIDPQNKVRLIRAIEIAKTLGSVPKISTRPISARPCLAENKFEVFKIGLTLPPEILNERIKTRLLKRIQKGMIKEVENLHKEGVSWKRMNDLGLEYRYVSYFLQNKISKEEMINKLNIEIWHFAKRQKTWFKRDKSIIWINPDEIHEKALAFLRVKDFLK